MSQFTWESEGVEVAQQEQQAAEPQPAADQPEAADQNQAAEQQQGEGAAQPGHLALSPDDFSALEERIVRAVDLVKRGRVAHAAAEERAIQAEVRVREQAPLVEHLQKEVNALRAERDQMRKRVERLLEQLNSIEL